MMKGRPHCLVVGVGAGTGLACVRRFVAEGYKVSMIARHQGRLDTWANEIAYTAPYAADIMDIESFQSTLAQIYSDQGVPKVIVYNASLATFTHYSELDPKDF